MPGKQKIYSGEHHLPMDGAYDECGDDLYHRKCGWEAIYRWKSDTSEHRIYDPAWTAHMIYFLFFVKTIKQEA